MDKEKALEILEDLKCYIDENWERPEYENDIKESMEALDFALKTIRLSTVCGELKVDGKSYLISK